MNCQFLTNMHVFLDIISCHNLFLFSITVSRASNFDGYTCSKTCNKKMTILSLFHIFTPCVSLNISGRPSRTMLISVHDWILNENAPKSPAWTCLLWGYSGYRFSWGMIVIKFSVYYILSCCCRFFYIHVTLL